MSVLELGRRPYAEAWALQRELVTKRRAGEIDDTLLLVEHPPTYTIGRSGSRAHVLVDAAALGIELFEVDRGGDATYHGPGQIVGYPIVDLRPRGGDVHRYLRDLEEVLLATLADFGLVGARDDRFTGVWVDGRKVAQIGVKVSGGIASHGFALNVDTDDAHWAGIVPCGIRGRDVTSMARVLDRPLGIVEVQPHVVRHAASVLALDPVPA